MKDFRNLAVWQKAHELTLEIYRVTAAFPREELFGITSQLRRSAAGTAANLAEGCGRNGNAELGRFCSFAMGSASELEYHLLLARDLKFLRVEEHQKFAGRATEVKKMLSALIRKLNADRKIAERKGPC